MVIYKAEFPNGKVYIGRTKNFNNRIYQHIWNSKRVENNHITMYRAIRKYKPENIKWEILCECSDIKEMKEKEIYYIKLYNSTLEKFGYNMVCGDKEIYKKRENFEDGYMVDIIKRKLKSNGHDPEKYIVIGEKLSEEIKNDYINNKFSIRKLVKKYKISKQRLTRFLISNNIHIDRDICIFTNSIHINDETTNKIIEKYKSGLTIKKISEENNLTIMIVSRILNDSGVRKSKRFNNGKRYDGKQPKKRQSNCEIK